MRVRVRPKSRKAYDTFVRHLKYDDVFYVDERRDKWQLCNINRGIQIWVDPRNDPDWEIIL